MQGLLVVPAHHSIIPYVDLWHFAAWQDSNAEEDVQERSPNWCHFRSFQS